MSGKIVNNVFRASGVIAATPGGLDWSTAVVTGSTLTATAGKGYFINTTSNACTVTLPSSAEIGDQIVFADYARTWSTNNVIIDSNGLNFQGSDDTYTVDYDTAGQSLNIVYSDATKGWLPVSDDAVAFNNSPPPTQKAIFGFGSNGGPSNLVSSSGVVAADVTRVGTNRNYPGACTYGGDKAIFAFGAGLTNVKNLVSNSGVVAADGTGVGTARQHSPAAGYGGDKGIFGYGTSGSGVSMTNLVSNSGVVASDTTGVGTAREALAAVTYGSDKAIFGFGRNGGTYYSITNLVSNQGVVSADVTGVGTTRTGLSAASYGSTGQAIFAYGWNGSAGYLSMSNLVSNSGVVSTDTTGVGTVRQHLGGSGYGADKAIFAFGENGTVGIVNTRNLCNNVGVIAADAAGVGQARYALKAAGFSTSA